MVLRESVDLQMSAGNWASVRAEEIYDQFEMAQYASGVLAIIAAALQRIRSEMIEECAQIALDHQHTAYSGNNNAFQIEYAIVCHWKQRVEELEAMIKKKDAKLEFALESTKCLNFHEMCKVVRAALAVKS